MQNKTDPSALLEKHLPRCGPSWGGGLWDARHRQIDVIRENVAAGDSCEAVAEDHGLPVELVRWLVGLSGEELREVLRVEPKKNPGGAGVINGIGAD